MERESKKMEREFIRAAEGDREERRIFDLPLITKELVFSKLPVESICRSRVVCKEWNFILSSQRFLSSLPIQNPWLLICGKEMNETWVCMAYCFSAQKWMTLSLSLPPDLDISGDLSELIPFFFEFEPDLSSYDPLSSFDTGIVIWELFQDEEDELIWKWKEFARIPPHSLPQYVIEYLNDYFDMHWLYGECACVGEYLCFNAAPVFAYNLKCGFWQRLPPHKSHYSNQKMVSFEPKLYQFPRKSSE
ncbi:hypothetical protein SUGI_0249970 [Cryptomeria japonica]|nr:hypothetical protein SUGI_0249970 [Cryptomeria japonica]